MPLLKGKYIRSWTPQMNSCVCWGQQWSCAGKQGAQIPHKTGAREECPLLLLLAPYCLCVCGGIPKGSQCQLTAQFGSCQWFWHWARGNGRAALSLSAVTWLDSHYPRDYTKKNANFLCHHPTRLPTSFVGHPNNQFPHRKDWEKNGSCVLITMEFELCWNKEMNKVFGLIIASLYILFSEDSSRSRGSNIAWVKSMCLQNVAGSRT